VTVVRWARHGQSGVNVSLTLSHRVVDTDLTELGRQQATELGERLAADPLRVRAVVCSPLRRARQTAAVVAARLGLGEPTMCEDLRELDVGTLDGRYDHAAWEVYHQVLAAWSDGLSTVRFPGGENALDLAARVGRALETAAAPGHDPAGRPTDSCVLVVAHGGNVRCSTARLTGTEPGPDLPNCGWVTFEVSRPGPVIRVLEW
jgi:probable phosphoglycerate mutase